MPHGRFSLMDVDDILELFPGHLLEFGQKRFDVGSRKLRIRGRKKDFHAIASGKKNHLFHTARFLKRGHRPICFLPGKSQAFPQFNRRGFMVQPYE
jgi:hypothetical protein